MTTAERLAWLKRQARARSRPRERLAARLRDAGFDVEACQISGALGWYRIEQKYDDTPVCWSVWATKIGSSFPNYFIYSRCTMTECGRCGINLCDPDDHYIEVVPKARPKR